MEYRVQQKATIWYETRVQASSPEEAIEIIQDPETNIDLDWWQVLDSTEFQDVFWWQDQDENEGDFGIE
ncbi:MAG: hypothetical protein EBR82_26640 [Caulobacteraceae bacterium]|nr:hypothetical protein [Caulobacteraceae bacterium]